jgi:hypothetical protein
VGVRGGARVVRLGDREAPFPAGELVAGPLVRPDGGVGALVRSDGAVRLRWTFAGAGGEEARYDDAADLVVGEDGRSWAFAARRGATWFVVVNGKEGPAWDRVVTPQLSPDGTRVAYRARQQGRRFVVVADAEGRTVRVHRALEQVFPVRFGPDGRSIAYGAKEGREALWIVEAP